MEYFLIFSILLILIIFVPFVISGFSGAVFYPTDSKVIREAIKLSNIKPSHNIIDLGSGDGRFVFESSSLAKNVTGVEIHPLLILFSQIKSKLRKHNNVKILFKDFWSVDLKIYDLVYVFLYPGKMSKFEKKVLKEMRKGATLISYAFKLPNIKPEIETESGLYLYRF